MSVDQNLLSQLAGKSQKELELLIEASRKQLKTINRKDDENSSEEIRKKLKPYEEAFEKAELGYSKVKTAYDNQINELKKRRKEALEQAEIRRKATKNELNSIRQELGLKITRRSSLGPSMSWEVKIDLKRSVAVVQVSEDNTTRSEISVTDVGRVSAKELKDNLFNVHNIQDEGGGKARGLMTRIKLAYLNAIEDKETKEKLR